MVACLSAAMSGSTDPGKQVIPSARRILEKSEALQTAINRSSGYTTIGGEQRLVWKPDIERIERVVVKNARGQPPSFRAARAAAKIISLSVEGEDVW
jgi:hypothetical protein